MYEVKESNTQQQREKNQKRILSQGNDNSHDRNKYKKQVRSN